MELSTRVASALDAIGLPYVDLSDDVRSEGSQLQGAFSIRIPDERGGELAVYLVVPTGGDEVMVRCYADAMELGGISDDELEVSVAELDQELQQEREERGDAGSWSGFFAQLGIPRFYGRGFQAGIRWERGQRQLEAAVDVPADELTPQTLEHANSIAVYLARTTLLFLYEESGSAP